MALQTPPRDRNRTRSGALVAYVYELMDEGPRLERAALLAMISERAMTLVGADAAVVWVGDEDGHAHAEPLCGSANPSAAAVAVERAFVDLIATEGNQVLSSMEPPLRPGLVEDCDKVAAECSGVVCVGLQRREDYVGALCLHRVGGGPLEAWEGADVERFARFAALAIHQMTERERAERDEVTGLPGRTFLLRELDQRIDSGRPFGLGCIDFDGLKAVNDRLGYEAGNLLICAVANAVAGQLRRGELVGRLHGRGGDEFVCLLDEEDERSLERRCRLLEAALDRAAVPAELAPWYLGVSIGAALANGSTRSGEVFSAAEAAMRTRKQQRRRSQGRGD
jgi:diguanylate cyclase (GGDEF)-like protein